MKTTSIIIVALLLTGCTSTPVRLQNTDGRIAQCGPYTIRHPLFPGLSPHWKQERNCVADFQHAGYERIPD